MRSPKIGTVGAVTIAFTAPVISSVLAFATPTLGVLCLGSCFALATLLLACRVCTNAASIEKLSGEIDVIAQHILKIEALTKSTAERVLKVSTQQAQAMAAPPAPKYASEPARGVDELGVRLEEVTAEIALLSGLVRDLAGVASTHEGEFERLKAAVDAASSIAKSRQTKATVVVEPAPAPPLKPLPIVPFPVPAPEASGDSNDQVAVIDAFDGDGLEIWLQPIVTLPRRKVVSYEASARIHVRDQFGQDDVRSAKSFAPILERHGRTTALDRRMLQSAATIAQHLKTRGSEATVSYALSPLSLHDPDFLRSLPGLVSDEADLPGRLLIALPQANWRDLDREQAAMLTAVKDRIGFILDRPNDLRFEPAVLAEQGVKFVKVPASLLLRPASQASLSDLAVEDLVTALSRRGLRLIVSDVDEENDISRLIEMDVSFGQGEVFAAARAVRAEVLAEAPPAAPGSFASEPEPVPEVPSDRRPFRDFLRRAV